MFHSRQIQKPSSPSFQICDHLHGSTGYVAGDLPRTVTESVCGEFPQNGAKTAGIQRTSATVSRHILSKLNVMWWGIHYHRSARFFLTHRGRVTHICVSKITIIGSDNGLSPDRRQTVIWTNAGILLIGPIGTNFSEILIEILTASFKKMHLKGLSVKWWPLCLCLNVLKDISPVP